MHIYLQPEDDDLPMCSFGAWVAEKLDYVKRYIDIFEKSMRNKPWRKRHYIDLFAGTGKCIVPETKAIYLGSPLLSLTTSYPFTDYFFVDLKPENITALKQRCSVSPTNNCIQYFVDDGNLVVQEIIKCILATDHPHIPGKWSSLNLAFLDPYGLELRWATIATLSQPYSMDLIIHYPQGGLNRNIRQAFNTEEETAIDTFFGGTEWRKIYEPWQNKSNLFGLHRLLMDHYKEKLQDLGYKETLRDDEVGDEPLMRNAKKNAPLYRLLFASKNELGLDFWRKVNHRNVHGQMRLL